jgi:hypothetical protein
LILWFPSLVAIIEERLPVEKEKLKTPMSMRRQQKSLSAELTPDISPYPTVVIVVITK